MQTHTLIQGSPEWAAHRAKFKNASDAPVMLGCSPYKTRQQLLKELSTGLSAEVDPALQARFDAGHRFEALARPLAEGIIGDDLAPVVASEGEYSASFDGLTLMSDVAFEHKSLNNELRNVLGNGCTTSEIPKHYRVQMEQQCMVAGCEKVLFMATQWAGDDLVEERHCWYYPDPVLRAEIVAGWRQFDADMAAYQPTAAAPVVVAAAQPSLPAPVVRMDGALTVASNLPDFAVALRAYIDNIPKTPSSDQEFADCEAACKSLKKAEDALQQAEDGALAQMTNVEQMRRVVGDLRTLARTTRLASEKMVAARKEQIRTEIYESGCKAYRDHIAGLNARLGKTYMPTLPVDFAGAIKNKRTVDSLRDAVATHLATVKIAANEVADRIQINLDYLREHAKDHAFLFADTASIVLKAPDDLAALAQSRIMAHQKAEADRLERERAAIAEQERVKAEAKLRAEQEAAAKAKALEAVAPPAQAQPVAEESAPVPVQTFTPPAPYAVERTELVPAASPPTMTNGKVCQILGFNVTADFLVSIGAPAPTKQANANLWHDRQILDILEVLGAHMSKVYAEQKAKYQPARTRTAA